MSLLDTYSGLPLWLWITGGVVILSVMIWVVWNKRKRSRLPPDTRTVKERDRDLINGTASSDFGSKALRDYLAQGGEIHYTDDELAARQ